MDTSFSGSPRHEEYEDRAHTRAPAVPRLPNQHAAHAKLPDRASLVPGDNFIPRRRQACPIRPSPPNNNLPPLYITPLS